MATKHRSQRGSLTSKIKDAIFQVYGEANLPSISMSATPTDINNWKQNPAIRRCYEKLHQPISENNDPSVTHILRIMERVF